MFSHDTQGAADTTGVVEVCCRCKAEIVGKVWAYCDGGPLCGECDPLHVALVSADKNAPRPLRDPWRLWYQADYRSIPVIVGDFPTRHHAREFGLSMLALNESGATWANDRNDTMSGAKPGGFVRWYATKHGEGGRPVTDMGVNIDALHTEDGIYPQAQNAGGTHEAAN